MDLNLHCHIDEETENWRVKLFTSIHRAEKCGKWDLKVSAALMPSESLGSGEEKLWTFLL